MTLSYFNANPFHSRYRKKQIRFILRKGRGYRIGPAGLKLTLLSNLNLITTAGTYDVILPKNEF